MLGLTDRKVIEEVLRDVARTDASGLDADRASPPGGFALRYVVFGGEAREFPQEQVAVAREAAAQLAIAPDERGFERLASSQAAALGHHAQRAAR